MNSDRRDRLRAGLIAASTMFLLLVLINLTVYAITMNSMVVSMLALISLIYFAGVTLAIILPASRRAATPEVEHWPEGRDEAGIEALDGLAEELERIAEFPDGRDPSRAPDQPVPPL